MMMTLCLTALAAGAAGLALGLALSGRPPRTTGEPSSGAGPAPPAGQYRYVDADYQIVSMMADLISPVWLSQMQQDVARRVGTAPTAAELQQWATAVIAGWTPERTRAAFTQAAQRGLIRAHSPGCERN